MSDEDLKTLSYEKTGRIRVDVDGELHTLRRPKYGEFRRIKDKLIEAQATIKDAVEVARHESESDDVDEAPASTQSELVNTTLNAFSRVTLYVFNGADDEDDDEFAGLSNHVLPRDVDDWPAWLVLNNSIIQEFIAHWRAVPLVRG